MLDAIIKFSINNRLLIIVGLIGLIIGGVYSVKQLPIDAIPDVTNNQVQVITVSPNLSASEIEQFITYPLETSLQNIQHITELRSISRFGLSVITIVFDESIDIFWARSQVNERLSSIKEVIPQGYGTPNLAPITTGLGEIFQYTLEVDEGYSYNLMELRDIQDKIVRKQLLGTKGVADVSSFGGQLKQYQIQFDREKLKAYAISVNDLFSALENGNANTGAGYIEQSNNAYFIRGIGLAQSLEDLEQILVTTKGNQPILVKDVAQVNYGYALRYGAMTSNGKGETVGAIIMMLKGENSREVITTLKEKLQVIQKSLPKGVHIKPYLDRELLVDRAIHTVSKNLIEGALIVIFVLVLFLGHLRAGFIVASVIPLAMLFAIIMMVTFGVSGNLMSLGALDFGLLVDGAIIIVENIISRLGQQKQKNTSSEAKNKTVFNAAKEMISSSISGQFIIFIVYVPLLALVGVEGKMFKPMALTVMFALAGALILSVTYVPMMSAWLLKSGEHHAPNFSDKIMNWLENKYYKLFKTSIRNHFKVMGASLVLLIVSFIIFSTLGGEFIPELDEGDYAIEVRMLPGTSLSESIRISTLVQKELLEKLPHEIQTVVSKIGSSEIPTDPMPIEAQDVIVNIKDKSEWTAVATKAELTDTIAQILEGIPGIVSSVQQPISMRFNELMTGGKSDVVIRLYGNDFSTLTQVANKIAGLTQKIQGAEDVVVQQLDGLPQIQIHYNRGQMARYGFTITDVNSALETSFAGKKAGLIIHNNYQYDVVVKQASEQRKDYYDLENILVSNASGTTIPLAQLAEIRIESGTTEITRFNAERCIAINLNARNRDLESLVHDIMAQVNQNIVLPAGYHVDYSGDFKNLNEAKKTLGLVLPLALGLIVLLLYLTFKSVKESLIIFSAIPFSAIGGIFALWLRGMPFSISAGVGFIALFGIAVLNGMVLIGAFTQLKTAGIKNPLKRISKGVKERFRPVITTATVAALGFLPMALATGSGAEVQKPLATVVIGGLVSATLLTLILIPLIYFYTYSKTIKKNESHPI